MDIMFRTMLEMLMEAWISPFGILCFLWAIVLQFLIFWSTEEKLMRWMLPILFGGGTAGFIALILLFESFFALLAIALLPYLVIVLIGTLIGTVLYKLWTKVHTS